MNKMFLLLLVVVSSVHCNSQKEADDREEKFSQLINKCLLPGPFSRDDFKSADALDKYVGPLPTKHKRWYSDRNKYQDINSECDEAMRAFLNAMPKEYLDSDEYKKILEKNKENLKGEFYYPSLIIDKLVAKCDIPDFDRKGYYLSKPQFFTAILRHYFKPFEPWVIKKSYNS